MSDLTLPPAGDPVDGEEVLVLGPETVVARSQQPIPKPPRPERRAPKRALPKPTGRRATAGDGSTLPVDQVPLAPCTPFLPESDAVPATPGNQPTTPSIALHTFYWPTKSATKGKAPHIFRSVFETKNHPR